MKKSKWKDEADKIFNNAVKVFKAIDKVSGGGVPKEDVSGMMKCPVCKKLQMEYFVSNYNGHRHAYCECFGNICE